MTTDELSTLQLQQASHNHLMKLHSTLLFYRKGLEGARDSGIQTPDCLVMVELMDGIFDNAFQANSDLGEALKKEPSNQAGKEAIKLVTRMIDNIDSLGTVDYLNISKQDDVIISDMRELIGRSKPCKEAL